jgi:predicted transcriptional regulator
MNCLLEEFCKKLINQQRIEWFSIRHAKTLTALKKYEKLQASEITLLANTEKHSAIQTLQELKKAKLIQYDGEKFSLIEETELMQKLFEIAEERKEIKAIAVCKY